MPDKVGEMNGRRRRGFTLIEVLVVIGILAVLVGIILPATVKARRQAKETRCRADMQAIATAIAAYREDHGDIPRAEQPPHEPTLCNALVAPGPQSEDGQDGPGFKTRKVVQAGQPVWQGKTYGPYLDVSKFRWDASRRLLDVYDNPYSYVPGLRGQFVLTSAGEDGKFGTKDDLQ